MGNYRFRLSDMIPNAWFYKLRDTSSRTRNKKHHRHQPTTRSTSSSSSSLAFAAAAAAAAAASASASASSSSTTTTTNTFLPPNDSKPTQPHLSQQRKSYYFSRHLHNSPEGHLSCATITNPKKKESDPPRKSSSESKRGSTNNNNKRDRRLGTSSFSATCSCRATLESVCTSMPAAAAADSTSEDYPNSPLDTSSSSEHDSLLPEFGSDHRNISPITLDSMVSWSASCRCGVDNDILFDKDDSSKPPPCNSKLINNQETHDGLDTVSDHHLPPIITKQLAKYADVEEGIKKKPTNFSRKRYSPNKFEVKNSHVSHGFSATSKKERKTTTTTTSSSTTAYVRKFSVNSPRLKLRTNSPRIGSSSKRIQRQQQQQQGRKSVSSRSLSESCVVTKSSTDPRRDFRESMVEMIVENNIRASTDLEDLLACYLSLNSDEYHDLIIKVFKQIWFDLTEIRLFKR